MGQEYQRIVQVVGHIPVSPSVILFDDLEGQLNWEGSGSGTDWIVDKASGVNACMRGSYGLRLATKATNPTAGDYVVAIRRVAMRRWRVIEFSFHFRHAIAELTKFLVFRVGFFSGSFFFFGAFRWDGVNTRWQYCDSIGSWVDLPGGFQRIHWLCWNFLRFVISFEDKSYKSFQCNDLVCENLRLMIANFPHIAFPYLEVSLFLRTTADSQQVAYFDDILVQETL